MEVSRHTFPVNAFGSRSDPSLARGAHERSSREGFARDMETLRTLRKWAAHKKRPWTSVHVLQWRVRVGLSFLPSRQPAVMSERCFFRKRVSVCSVVKPREPSFYDAKVMHFDTSLTEWTFKFFSCRQEDGQASNDHGLPLFTQASHMVSSDSCGIQ